jgi:virginiamycin B lyase
VSLASAAQYPKTKKEKPGSLTGEVVTTRGAAVAGAQILWQAADGGVPHVLHSDAHGHFHVEPLGAGLYDVRASAGGTWSSWEHNVTVRPGSEANVTLRLSFKTPPAHVAVELKGTSRTWDVPVSGAVPRDAAVDPKGDIWFTFQQSGHLARFNPDTKEWSLFKVPTPQSGPQGLAADASGNIWFTENHAGKVGRLDVRTGSIAEYVPPSAKDPTTSALGPDGGIWFTSQNSNLIGRLDPATGKISEYSVPTQNAQPDGIVSAGDGGLWFCEFEGQKLGRVDPASGVIGEFSPQESEVHPRRLVAVGDALYFTDAKGGRLGRLSISNKHFKLWDSPSGSASAPDGIAADETGKIWYVESAESANKLVRFDPAVEVFRVFPLPNTASEIRNIARDAHGRLWMPLSTANKILAVE